MCICGMSGLRGIEGNDPDTAGGVIEKNQEGGHGPENGAEAYV